MSPYDKEFVVELAKDMQVSEETAAAFNNFILALADSLNISPLEACQFLADGRKQK